MTMTITLDEQTSERLKQIADEDPSHDINRVVALLLRDAVTQESDVENDARLDEMIAEGLADIAAGRVTPLEQAAAQARAKHGLPA